MSKVVKFLLKNEPESIIYQIDQVIDKAKKRNIFNLSSVGDIYEIMKTEESSSFVLYMEMENIGCYINGRIIFSIKNFYIKKTDFIFIHDSDVNEIKRILYPFGIIKAYLTDDEKLKYERYLIDNGGKRRWKKDIK